MKRNTAQPTAQRNTAQRNTAQPTATHTAKAGTMNTAHSPQPTVKIPAGTPRVPWSVKGRGKSATYCAGLPAGSGQTGQRVALVAQSGAVTFAVLTTIRETADNVTRWDFDRDAERMTADVRRSNRAAKATHTAEYWQSDAGLVTAQRIAQRQAQRTAQPTDVAPVSQPTAAADGPRLTDGTSTASEFAAVITAMLANGASADDVARFVQLMNPTPVQPTAPAVASQPTATQPTAPNMVMMSPSPDLETCDACNRERRGCGSHAGAPDLLVCPRCATLDADTARVRAQRHNGK
jgi:hypothetical protein